MNRREILHLNNTQETLDEPTVALFSESLRGPLIQPGDPGYDDARAIYNGMIDKFPAFIAQCADVADVMSCVNFARDNQILTAVRGGGHNGPGLGTCDRGLVIDMSRLNGIRVDPKAQTARVGAGCTWGDVDHATHPYGLAAVSGIMSTTGVAGLTLGGGHGYLTRKYGLSADNLLSADVVLADGSIVTASEDEHADLFWALRGGGGNFGIVTSFEFQLHPVEHVQAGPMLWDNTHAPELMRGYRDFFEDAPEELYAFFTFLQVPDSDPFPQKLRMQRMCGLVWCCIGDEKQTRDAIAPLMESLPEPAMDGMQTMSYPAVQSMFDVFYPSGLQWYWKGAFIDELSDAAIAEHMKHGLNVPTPESTMHLYPIDGAVHDMAEDETAFSYRNSRWSQVIVGVTDTPAQNHQMIDWARGYYRAIEPYSAGGTYVNFMMEEGDKRLRASYRDNFDRLVDVKSTYDPGNLFRVNQNIKPRRAGRDGPSSKGRAA